MFIALVLLLMFYVCVTFSCVVCCDCGSLLWRLVGNLVFIGYVVCVMLFAWFCWVCDLFVTVYLCYLRLLLFGGCLLCV